MAKRADLSGEMDVSAMSHRFGASAMTKEHADYTVLAKIRDALFQNSDGADVLKVELPKLIKSAVDFVIDPVRTGRTTIADLDRVEKAFIGLKIEHYLRDWLDVPKGLKRDISLDGIDVDIKNTIGATWMIPPETYRHGEPCLLIATAKFDGRCWLGLILAKPQYLGAKNRDGKRAISAEGCRNIFWLVQNEPYPASDWDGLNMARFRELRAVKGGTNRAVAFFRENVGKVVNRAVLQALLHDQRDYMKRIRGNGGARDKLLEEKIRVLSGAYDAKFAERLGHKLAKDEFVAINDPG